MDNQAKRILILTADAGFGHRSAAKAVAEALDELYGKACEVTILNPLDNEKTPFFLRDSQSDYDRIVKELPEIYRLGYEASDTAIPGLILENAITISLQQTMLEVLRQYQPDAILSTYPLYQAPLKSIFLASEYNLPLLTVVTDLVTVHRLWFHKKVDACLVPNAIVRDLAESLGVPADRIHITGIPVSPQISREQRSQAEIRASLGWRPDLPTFLAVGSRRVENLVESLNVLNHFGRPLQLAVVAGKDDELYAELQKMDWHVPAHIYNFVDFMPSLMHAADGLICKAGGLVVTEALACGLPMMLVDVLPGQETGNAQYVVDAGAGDLVRTPMAVLETAAHWMAQDGALLKQRAANARQIGMPRSAYAAAELTWQAAAAPRSPVEPSQFRQKLTELGLRLESEAQKLAMKR